MSASTPPDTSREPRGLPLGLPRRHDPDGGMAGYVDVGDEVRSQLAATTFVALASVVVLAGGGAVVAAGAWLPPAPVSIFVAAGSVLVSLASLGRGYFLCRTIPSARSGLDSDREPFIHGDEPPAAWEAAPEDTPGTPSSAAGSMDPAESVPGQDPGLALRPEVFGRLAYRLQSLVNRLIHRIDKVEQEIEDPELLKSLYAIDHLATRIRRQVENLAVLGGEAPQRRSDIPVEANAVLRAAVAEIEHYTQVTTVPIREVKIRGHVVAEIVHLLAELLENATTFTTPEAPKVMLRAHPVTAGLAIQVQDRGIGLSTESLARINRLLDDSTQVDVGQLLQDGRIGLAVVKILAQRHGIGAELQPNIFGGTDTAVVIPHELLSEAELPYPTSRVVPPMSAESSRPGGTAPAPSRSTGTPHASGAPGTAPHQPRPGPQAQPYVPGEAGSHITSQPPSPTVPQVSSRASDPAPESTAGESFQDGALPRRRGQSQSLPKRRPGDAERMTVHEDDGRTADRRTHIPRPGADSAGRSERPALPQRQGSHMPDQLREPPEPTQSTPGHSPTLMASILEGRGRAEQAQPDERESDPPHGTPRPHTRNTERDSTSWPT